MKCQVDMIFNLVLRHRGSVHKKISPCDSLSRKTTIQGPRRTIQAGKRHVMPKADKSILYFSNSAILSACWATRIIQALSSLRWISAR